MNTKELKKAMIEADCTQSKLAKELGLTLNTLNLKINGKGNLILMKRY